MQTRAASASLTNPPIVLTIEGTNVFIQRFRSNVWESAYPAQILHERDRGRTGMRSRTAIRLSDLSVMRIGPQSDFEIQPLPDAREETEFSLLKGLLYLLNRDRPGAHRFRTPTATAATRGTEFTLEVEEVTGRTILTVMEGEAELSNAVGSLRLVSGEQGIAVLGQMPTRTAGIDTTNIIQWCLYYPGVLDLAELRLTAAEEASLAGSLAAYRSGDLLQAVASYPAARTPVSDSEKIYVGALLLAVGQVAQTEALLDSLTDVDSPDTRSRRLAAALRLVIAAVKLRAQPSTLDPRSENRGDQTSTALATEWLADSYARQSVSQLSAALAAARMSVRASPEFAFGWTRVAELEFSHGRMGPALRALEKSLELAPRNAQALALKGFLLSAQNRIREATGFFEQAIALDGGLGNAWLGRGLCRIRQGHAEEGRFDLQVAATVEPQRSLLRSYLGKAFSKTGHTRRAETELELARLLDAGDPTPWLYSALLLQRDNRINEAVHDLEESQRLNDNRQVYRSQLLLDQDRAVRGANLATVYRDAGLTDVSLREAARAVNADYANYSAHLFLADTYNQLRDLKQINLRYDTAWFSEYLMANLLAPVGAGTLAQTVSQQEYSKLLEEDGLGLTSSTEYFSDGEWIQNAVQHGTFGNSSYAAQVFYHSDTGDRPNNDLSQFTAVVNLKQQITSQDSVYARVSYYRSESGDVNQYYDQADANRLLRTEEHYDPSVLAGYHREWSPGNHTLFLGGFLQNTYEVENPLQGTLFFNRGRIGDPIREVAPLIYDQHYESDLDLYSAEAQQLWQRGDHTVVLGGRFQVGQFDTYNQQTNGQTVDGPVAFSIQQNITSDLLRATGYLYEQWQIVPTLLLVGGISYDWLEYPDNYRYAPLSGGQRTIDQVSPKLGLIWTPARNTTVRAAYFRGLGGVSLDQSVRLEPSQVAGFNQAYRSLIPESVVGANAVPTFTTAAFSVEQKFGRGTFVGIWGELLSSEVNRTVGVVERAVSFATNPPPPFSTRGTREQLEFYESTLNVSVNQLLSDEWSVGVRYRLSRAELDRAYPEIPANAQEFGGFQAHQNLEATLNQVHLFALFNHPSGFFAGANAIWTAQSNDGYTPSRPGDDFWQFNLEAGWRFARRRVEVGVALLNLADQDYKLNPLNLTAELPRERTLAVRLRLNF